MPKPINDLDIDLYISTQCPHCSQVVELLSKAVKQGKCSRLNITNLANATVKDLTIRSVPYIKIQDFEFTGAITASEIDTWSKAHRENKFAHYYLSSLLMDGKLSTIESLIKKNSEYCIELIELAKDIETKMQIRIGVTAIFESLYQEIVCFSNIKKITEILIKAISASESAMRVDLIYIASLLYSGFKAKNITDGRLFDLIESLSSDESDEVKDIVKDVLV